MVQNNLPVAEQMGDIETILTTATQALNTARAYEVKGAHNEAIKTIDLAQELNIAARTRAEALLEKKPTAESSKLEELVHDAKRSLAISHVTQAHAHYAKGTANYNQQTELLTPEAEQSLEKAAEKYQHAINAFGEFADAFKTEGERSIRQERLNSLFLFLVDTYSKLAKNKHVQGNNLINESTAARQEEARQIVPGMPAPKISLEDKAKDLAMQGIEAWDAALKFYDLTKESYEAAKAAGVQLDESWKRGTQQMYFDVSTAQIATFNAYGMPEKASKRLQNLQKLLLENTTSKSQKRQ